MTSAFRYSMCNEAFEKWPFADACKSLRKAGYTGIEIAPFTLGEDPALVTAAQRRAYRDIMESEGLSFVGLHWLMVSPKGLHVTGPDERLRQRSWTHVWNLIGLCADLGPDGVLVFGSPAQPASLGGVPRGGLGALGATRRRARRDHRVGGAAGESVRRGTTARRSRRHRA